MRRWAERCGAAWEDVSEWRQEKIPYEERDDNGRRVKRIRGRILETAIRRRMQKMQLKHKV